MAQLLCTAPRKDRARMYHVECIDIHKDDILFSYADRASLCANNMYKTASVINTNGRSERSGRQRAFRRRSVQAGSQR